MVNESRRAWALVRSIISFAKALELDVIAERAETTLRVETLAQLGCIVIPACDFGKPSTADDVSRYPLPATHPLEPPSPTLNPSRS